MKSTITLLLLVLILASCNRKRICTDAEQRIPGKVLHITGPDSLRNGETVPLVVEVAANDSFCIKKAEALILDTMDNYVQVGANIVHTGLRSGNDCDCMKGQKIYTVIYFTPKVSGTYIFGTEKPDPLVTNGWADSTSFHVIVR